MRGRGSRGTTFRRAPLRSSCGSRREGSQRRVAHEAPVRRRVEMADEPRRREKRTGARDLLARDVDTGCTRGGRQGRLQRGVRCRSRARARSILLRAANRGPREIRQPGFPRRATPHSARRPRRTRAARSRGRSPLQVTDCYLEAWTAGCSEALDDARDRHPEADAHRCDAVPRPAALELVQQRRRDPCTGRAERVSERDPAAVRVDVVPTIFDSGVARELQDHRRECLVDLDHRHVLPRQRGAAERLRARLRIAVEHPMWVDAGQPERDEPRPRLQTEPRRRSLARDQHGGRAVADLRGVAGGHLPVGDERGVERRERLRRRVAARRLVDRELRAQVWVRQLDRDDLVGEPTGVDRIERAPVRLERQRVELLARESPFLGDHLRRDSLRDDLPPIEQRVRQVAPVRPHRHARHHLDAGGNDEVQLSRPNRRRRVHVRLHRRATLPVNGRAADGLGPSRDERDHSPEIPALLADLRDTAELDVLDLRRIEVVSRQQPIQDLGGHLVAADLGQRPVLLADRRSHGVDDVRSPHGTRVVPMAATATERKLLVGGEWIDTGDWIEVRSPYSGDVVGRVVKVGDPADEDTDIGPVIDGDARERILDWIRESRGRVLTGADLDGDLIRPTVIANPGRTDKVSCEEVFGPVCTVTAVDSLDEAIELANATRYGLQAGIFTTSLDSALRAAQALEFGGVTVNEAPTFRSDQMPYGGVKDSGNTREGPRYAVREMTEERVVVVELP